MSQASVAQIFNLPYRRFVIGNTPKRCNGLYLTSGRQNTIRRYGRLKTCATSSSLRFLDPKCFERIWRFSICWLAVILIASSAHPLHAALRAPSPSPFRSTGVLTDLAIDGEGFFILADPTTGEKFATRRGDIRIDSEGRLVNFQNLRVQGFNLPIRIDQNFPDQAAVGDIKLDKGSLPPGLPSSVAIAGIKNTFFDGLGRIIIVLSDGTLYFRGQILLQRFAKPYALEKRWLYLYSGFAAAQPLTTSGQSKSLNPSYLISGALETNFSPQAFLLLDRFKGETKIWMAGSFLQVSMDLANWVTVYTNQYPNNVVTDPEARDASIPFYRTISPFIKQTGVTTDLAISGAGFFTLRDAGDGMMFATRVGNFYLDARGFLVTTGSLRVQGYNTSISYNKEYPSPSPIGDLQFDKGTLPKGLPSTAVTAGISNINIDSNGRINVLLSDGSLYIRGQILLQNFENLFALAEARERIYPITDAAGPLAIPGKPNTQDLGRIDSGALEFSPGN